MRNAVNVRAKVDFGYVLVGVMKMGFTTHKRFKKGGEMKASELRLGNYYLYCIHDELDNPRDYEIVDQIDAQDLVWLSSEAGENDDQYKPIPLTEDWLKRFGFEPYKKGFARGFHNKIFSGCIILTWSKTLNSWELAIGKYKDITRVEFVHTFQNVIFALTGEELKLREEYKLS